MGNNRKIVTILGALVVIAAALRIIAGPASVVGTGAIYAALKAHGLPETIAAPTLMAVSDTPRPALAD
jgi:hypothetical protein